MNNILGKIVLIVVSLGFIAIAIWKLIKTKRDSDAIDSVADARVIKAINLGRGTDGKQQFAITYQVLIDDPFEILVTPTTRPVEMGTIATIYYDSQNHSNYYIPTKWKVDDRMKKAILTVIIAAGCVFGSLASLFN